VNDTNRLAFLTRFWSIAQPIRDLVSAARDCIIEVGTN
jgi:hypothetical protein